MKNPASNNIIILRASQSRKTLWQKTATSRSSSAGSQTEDSLKRDNYKYPSVKVK